MPPDEGEISHVSDTALMVAACRAMETARTDGLVRDPFAERLAGLRGMAIAQSIPGLRIMCFGVGVRTRFLDELITGTIDKYGLRTVVSLGAGLDTRPWRLQLPATLRWIEVDFPELLAYKSELMASVTTRCRLERMAANLIDASERHAVFEAIGGRPALMITEGLLGYLPGAVVEALAIESAASGIEYWTMDITSPGFRRRARVESYGSVQNVRAAGAIDGVQILESAVRNGWKPIEWRSYMTDAWKVAAERVQAMKAARATRVAQESGPPLAPDDPSGVHLLGRRPAHFD